MTFFITIIYKQIKNDKMKNVTFNTETAIEVAPLQKMLNYNGNYGKFGGAFVPDVLAAQLQKLSDFFDEITKTEAFKTEYVQILKDFVGRPSSLYLAKNLSNYIGSKIYLKREDLNHTGSHKINNAIGQILLAKKMGVKEIIAETGAGQHGVATATACAFLGLPCKIFMGAVDMERQALNVRRMQLLGAEVIACTSGNQTLKDAVDTALGYYIENPESYYLLGSQVGPHPYPKMVGYFQSIIGNEARQQILQKEGKLPDSIIACVGGGSNAIGLFCAFLDDKEVKIYGAEGGGKDIKNNTAATLNYGKPIIFQGTYSYCLTDDDNNPIASKSIAAGLDYPGISPQHAYLKDTNRATYFSVTDNQAIEAYQLLSRLEGITPAIESSHAVALALKLMKNKNQLVIINLSGRGDKDVERNM
ncbi:tryptophan synthase beta chain [Capnocytophaga catalasegens]|uniref:Tryptophan synthase beta chain n=2 Tax=Capnocytophaga catalasegens TaxID=1004260 RepID=A0AAV5AWV8_9FLAO|nr:tryptophan synthase beta chain [Capnocytophaga catalasegens]GJM49488.1 tryptophan synthase beta chain [Capnocytophaga catalasegens]GJM52847.1 tryptophan synthase beta chain [Capnocytophaga catalasegens]